MPRLPPPQQAVGVATRSLSTSVRGDATQVATGRRPQRLSAPGHQEGVPAGPCCTKAATFPDCGLAGEDIRHDADGLWVEYSA